MAEQSRQQAHERDDESRRHGESDGVPEDANREGQADDGVISSPIDFYESIRNRPDIKEILS